MATPKNTRLWVLLELPWMCINARLLDKSFEQLAGAIKKGLLTTQLSNIGLGIFQDLEATNYPQRFYLGTSQ